VGSVVVVSRKQTHIYILHDYDYKNNDRSQTGVKIGKNQENCNTA